jgi:phospholipid-binding lipoprotein MlaA
MRYYVSLIILLFMLSTGSQPVPCLAEELIQAPVETMPSEPASAENAVTPPVQSSNQPCHVVKDDDNSDYDDEPLQEEKATITDPIEPFNRAMYQVNDKMYFWLLKPVAQGYKAVVPEPARISVKNFFSNLKYPVRFVSCLLQADFTGAATETGRFAVNTVWGIGGLLDPAAGKELDLQKQDTDLGQTLGVYGAGHGFYIVWPFFGPSSVRDTADIIGNQVLYPLSFLDIWYASLGAKAVETVNSTSLRIGDYESLIGAAIDPYVAMRDAYVQYRMHDVKTRKAKSLLFKDAPEGNIAPDASLPQQ